MKKDSKQPPRQEAKRTAVDNRVEQRNQKENQVAQLSAADIEESPHMDRGDSAGGAGESLPAGSGKVPAPPRRGAVDTQYGTRSSVKPGQAGRTSSGGSGSSTESDGADPASPDDSSGGDRDTMTGPRPGGG